MAKCGDCVHYQKCSHYVTREETFPEVGGCSAFKNKGDFVEVVRCKDCKHYRSYGYRSYKYGNSPENLLYHCRFGIFNNQRDDEYSEHFCSYGERREGE